MVGCGLFTAGDTVGHPHSISTQALLEKANQVSTLLRVRRLRWLGHVALKPDTIVKQLLILFLIT